MGRRMKSYGPKALIPLYGDITLIERQLDILMDCYPSAEIFIVVGFQAEKIRYQLKDYPIRFIYNPLHESTNVLYSLGLAFQAVISTSAIIVYGDLIFNSNAVQNLRGGSKIIADANGHLRDDEVGLTIQDKKAMTFAYGLKDKWAQIAYLTEKELSLFKEISINSDTSQWFGYEGLNHVIKQGGNFEVIKPRTMQLLEIDQTKDLEKIAIID
ncbi:uncharacterized protein METZ01_LOCUS207834 [marine metagenome]|uniref:MobA-like NTP transferase domain-containing protein n=1 Tax=marine metagenome TaxID=408172 RepID=A0A382EW46_9ZZZZ